jgi:SAM-dependent methyltransferase
MMPQSAPQLESDSPRILPHNRTSASSWGAGGQAYDRISRQIADAIEHVVDRLDPQPGEKILDVGTGTGWNARRMAARGAFVTGIDIGGEVIAAARDLSPEGGIDFRVADAEALPFPDGHFDGVTSTFGVMFCSRPRQAAGELARVCKPSGRLALATWAPAGSVREMFEVIRRYGSPQSTEVPSPFAWGDTHRIVELLGDSFDLGFEEGISYYREIDGAAAFKAFAVGFGPVVDLLGRLDEETADSFRREFELFHERRRTGAGILVPREYVVTVGWRHV